MTLRVSAEDARFFSESLGRSVELAVTPASEVELAGVRVEAVRLAVVAAAAVARWLATPNPAFGGRTWEEMVRAGYAGAVVETFNQLGRGDDRPRGVGS